MKKWSSKNNPSPLICVCCLFQYLKFKVSRKFQQKKFICKTFGRHRVKKTKKRICVSAMTSSGQSNSYRWPLDGGKVLIHHKKLLCSIECPQMKNSRGQYCLSDCDVIKVNRLWKQFAK